MERETGVEPATSTLARSRSTTELLPLDELDYNQAASPRQCSPSVITAALTLRCSGIRHAVQRTRLAEIPRCGSSCVFSIRILPRYNLSVAPIADLLPAAQRARRACERCGLRTWQLRDCE